MSTLISPRVFCLGKRICVAVSTPNVHPVIMKNGGTSGFGNVIAISPTKDAAIFIGMNQIGADPAEKGVEILRRLP